MALSVNRVTLIGNVGKEPEQRTAASGTSVCNFSVATNERYQRDGEWKTKPEWHNIVVFGKSADYCGKYLHKGSSVYIEGKIQTRKWQDKSGADRWSTEIVAFLVNGLDSKREDGGGGGDEPAQSADDLGGAPASSGGEPVGGGNDDFPFSPCT